MSRKMPRQKPGQSKQNYGTPKELLAAILSRKLYAEQFELDLAAEEGNAIVPFYYDQQYDSLARVGDWMTDGWAWCNPPYARIEPWVQKAFNESRLGAQVAMLVPASVGSNWWKRWVHEKAAVYFLNPRIMFIGETHPFPKDCALLLYPQEGHKYYDVWEWVRD